MDLSWMETPTDKDRLLLKHCSGVRITTLILRTCTFTTLACGKWSLVTN